MALQAPAIAAVTEPVQLHAEALQVVHRWRVLRLAAQQALHDQVVAERDSVSGVNLDEEAADMLRYQQAYQASAKIIQTAQSLFDSVLNAVSR